MIAQKHGMTPCPIRDAIRVIVPFPEKLLPEPMLGGEVRDVLGAKAYVDIAPVPCLPPIALPLIRRAQIPQSMCKVAHTAVFRIASALKVVLAQLDAS